MKNWSDEEVLKRFRTVRHGSEAQCAALQEARKRGIFDPLAHLKASPIGQTIEALRKRDNKEETKD